MTIPDSVTSIGRYAFSDCRGLTSLTIGNGVTSIGDYAFEYCSGLTSVTIGKSVTSIGEGAFWNCSGLVAVCIHDLAAWCGIASGNNFLSYAHHLYLDGEELMGDLVIPCSVTGIGAGAFWGCSGLTNMTIPDSVTSIGEEAFWNCRALTSVTMGNGVTNIGSDAFSGCDNLARLYVPASWENTLMLAVAGVPEGCRVVYVEPGETQAAPVAVPHIWLAEQAEAIWDAAGGDYEASAMAEAANGRPVWECYLTGVDPTVSNQVFTASLKYDEDGNVTVAWTPDLNEAGTKSKRAYVVEGKKDIMDEVWTDVTEEEDVESEGWRFFRVGVKMP